MKDDQKLLVRQAKLSELEWLSLNQTPFSEPYNVPKGELRKE